MKAFITGATGFVGSHVARVLAEQGAEIRLLVRPTSNTANIDSLRADHVTGDLRNADSLRHAMAGCDTVFHVAADYRLWTKHPAEMYAANVQGTEAIIDAARKNRVRRVVYTSSVATMGFGNGTGLTDESTPVSFADMIGHYKKSKFLAEQLVLKAAAGGLDIVMVNPTTPIGERDIKPTPTGRIVVDFLKRKFPAYVDTGLNLVDVHDVAHGHIAAFGRGVPGERYILGGENLSLKQILDRLAAFTGLPSPGSKVPHAIAFAAAVFDTAFKGMLLGREPRATVDAVRMGRKLMFASSGKAERELGWRAGPVDGALRRAVAWFIDNGYAPPYASFQQVTA